MKNIAPFMIHFVITHNLLFDAIVFILDGILIYKISFYYILLEIFVATDYSVVELLLR